MRLSEIPFLDRYRQREAGIRDEGMDEMKQVSGVMTLSGLMQQQQAREQAVSQRQQMVADRQSMTPEKFSAKYASPDVMYREQNRPKSSTEPETIRLINFRDSLPEGHPVRAQIDARLTALGPKSIAEPRPQQPSGLSRLMQERDALPEGDPRRRVFDNAIRKESETSGQITPRITVQTGDGAGKPPPGYRHTAGGDLEAIPGGPADTKQQGQFNADTAVLEQTGSALDRLATATNEMLQSPGLGRITGIPGKLPNVPGMAGADAEAKLQTLKAQVGFGVLQDMRNASANKASGLGQITERELAFLQNALGALDKSQSEEQMRESLGKVLAFTQASKARLRNAYNLKHSARQPAAPEQTAPAGNKRIKLDANGNEVK